MKSPSRVPTTNGILGEFGRTYLERTEESSEIMSVPNSDDPILFEGIEHESKRLRGWDLLMYKCKQQPLVPIGAAATCFALIGAARMGYKKNSKGMQYFFRARVAAQAFTVLALWAGIYVYEDDRKANNWKAREKAEAVAKAKHDAWLAALDAANEAHLANQRPSLKQRLKLEPPPPPPEDPGPEPPRPAPQFKRYEYSHRNPVTGIVNVQPIIHYKINSPENPQHFPNLPWVEQLYRNHAERIWAAEKWREKEEEAIRQEKLANEQGLVGKFWNAVSKEEARQIELDENDVSTEALVRRAARQKPEIEKPVLKDSHRRREERAREVEENIRKTREERERREREELQRKAQKQ